MRGVAKLKTNAAARHSNWIKGLPVAQVWWRAKVRNRTRASFTGGARLAAGLGRPQSCIACHAARTSPVALIGR